MSCSDQLQGDATKAKNGDKKQKKGLSQLRPVLSCVCVVVSLCLCVELLGRLGSFFFSSREKIQKDYKEVSARARSLPRRMRRSN